MRRIALYPFALLYGVVIWMRNRLFDWGIFKSMPIPGKSICVGNLTVGGTGKSPHVAYLIELLSAQKPVQVLSRGYGRKTKGFISINEASTPQEVGDEPCMLYQAHKEKAQFAVCEKRRIGIENLKNENPNAVVILDDAFQHRWVKAGLQLVLTTYQQPMHQDALLPAGLLREPISGLQRANAIIVTKCPPFESFDHQLFAKAYRKWNLPVFFSRYQYKPLQCLTTPIDNPENFVLVSAIANPQHLREAFEPGVPIQVKSYPDHHGFSPSDLEEIHHFFDTFASTNTAIVTTAKDWVKIRPLLSSSDQQKYPWYLLDFELEWLDQTAFNQFISAYVVSN